MEKRPPKEDDQEMAEKAFNILLNAMKLHPEIEGNIWCAAVWSCLVLGYIESEAPYDYFCAELENIKIHYKPWWNKEKEFK